MSTTEQWYAVVDGVGNLISVGTVLADPATLAEAGYTAIALPGPPGNGYVWNTTMHRFDPPPPPPAVPTADQSLLNARTALQQAMVAVQAAINAQ